MQGRAATPEAEHARREKIAAWRRGRTWDDETKRRMRESAIINGLVVRSTRDSPAPSTDELLARA
jgi:hypothetical protein